MSSLFDSHTHLDDEAFDSDREEIIKKIYDSGVTALINIGCDLQSSRDSIALAEKYDFIYATVGIHPSDTAGMTEETLSEIEALAKHKKVTAIGEIGLDYHYDEPSRDIQKYWFKRQLELAHRLDMPVTIHNRESHADMMEILKSVPARGIIHCYSGSSEMARQLVNMGFYISLAGPLTYKNSKNAVETVKTVPIERLLIETDSPYLSPTGFRGQRNDSSHVRLVCEKMAEIKGLSFDETARITYENAKKVYEIDNII